MGVCVHYASKWSILFNNFQTRAAGEPVQKHTFRGGTSTLHTHIVCHKKSHFQVYKEHCDATGITMHSHVIPPGEDDIMTQSQSTLNGKFVCKPPTFTKEGLLEYIMELIVMEDEVHYFNIYIVSIYLHHTRQYN
jgi:hypothetical protein